MPARHSGENSCTDRIRSVNWLRNRIYSMASQMHDTTWLLLFPHSQGGEHPSNGPSSTQRKGDARACPLGSKVYVTLTSISLALACSLPLYWAWRGCGKQKLCTARAPELSTPHSDEQQERVACSHSSNRPQFARNCGDSSKNLLALATDPPALSYPASRVN